MLDTAREVVGLIALVQLTVGGWYIIGASFNQLPNEAAFLQRLFVASVVARVALAVGTYHLLPYGYLAPDEIGYVAAGRLLNSSGRLDLAAAINGQGWQYLNALLIHLFGVQPLLPRLWNCIVGGSTPVLCYAFARRLGAQGGARLSAILAAFFPSLVLWSSLNLKDADVWFLTLAGLLLVAALQDSMRVRYVVGFLLTIAVLWTLRQYPDLILICALVVGWLASNPSVAAIASRPAPLRSIGTTVAAATSVVAITLLAFPVLGEWAYDPTGERLADLRHHLAQGAHSATSADPGLQTLAGTEAFLPSAVRDFFLRPFPWEGGGTMSLITKPEMAVYYIVLLVAVVGIVSSLRTNTPRPVPGAMFIAVAGVGYSLALSNLGTIYREREQLILVLLAFVGVGVDAIVLVRHRIEGRNI